MSFFKDLKEDIAQSVNELAESFDDGLDETRTEEMPEPEAVPGKTDAVAEPEPEVIPEMAEPPAGETEELPVPDFADVLNGTPVEEEEAAEPEVNEMQLELESPFADEEVPVGEEPVEEEPVMEELPIEDSVTEEPAAIPAGEEPVAREEEEIPEEPETVSIEENVIKSEEELKMDAMNEDVKLPDEAAEEVTVITKGTTINGGIRSDTSLVVKGTIEGDVECQGKLTITGRVAGNTIASEIYVNTPRLEGDINSKGIVKIDVGTVVIGNVSCTSVLVSGAVKGNIEVNGPVIVDSTAVVKGDIKAKSIQINSGAVIDGHCSLQFADVDLDSFFE